LSNAKLVWSRYSKLLSYLYSLLEEEDLAEVGGPIDRPKGEDTSSDSGLVGAVIALSVVLGLGVLAAVAGVAYIKRKT